MPGRRAHQYADRRMASETGARLAARIAVATVCAIALLAFGSRGVTPGSAEWPGLVAGPPVVAAASPEASAPGGDTRSAGEGPGLVGAPFLAIIAVIALGLLAAGGTLLYLRLAVGPGERDRGVRRGRETRRD
jgi:hypothetical protein